MTNKTQKAIVILGIGMFLVLTLIVMTYYATTENYISPITTNAVSAGSESYNVTFAILILVIVILGLILIKIKKKLTLN